jgi:hypothetical protein
LNPRRVASAALAPITFTPSLLQSGKIGPKLAENSAAKAFLMRQACPCAWIQPLWLRNRQTLQCTQSGEGSHKMRETPDNDPDSS